jgi:phosphopantetheinyl transferase (holo-ACP synthase)
VVRLPSGKPTIAFRGKAAEFAQRLGTKNASISLSHTEQIAIAQVILEN